MATPNVAVVVGEGLPSGEQATAPIGIDNTQERVKLSSKAKFETLLNEIRGQLLQAQTSFDIWFNLQPQENEMLDTLNSFKGFFIPTLDAHLDRYFIKLGNVLDDNQKHKNAASFYRMLKMMRNDSSLAPGLDIDALQGRIEKGVAKRVKILRHTRAAHWQIGASTQDVYLNEIRDLLIELGSVFNDVHKVVYPQETWSFKVLESTDTQNVINCLQVHHALRPAAGIVAWTAVQDPGTPGRYFISSEALEKLRQTLQ